jgi:hypothetical protein
MVPEGFFLVREKTYKGDGCIMLRLDGYGQSSFPSRFVECHCENGSAHVLISFFMVPRRNVGDRAIVWKQFRTLANHVCQDFSYHQLSSHERNGRRELN